MEKNKWKKIDNNEYVKGKDNIAHGTACKRNLYNIEKK